MKILHYKIFFHAFRTALIFIAGFLSYDLLKFLEDEWNKSHPDNQIVHLAKRKSYHFLIIFLIDIFLLYLIALSFNIHL
jgi:hypothetical protein